MLSADLLIPASPTYKASYSGLLKAFLDRLGTGALATEVNGLADQARAWARRQGPALLR